MKNFISGLMKDLKLTWASQKPEWWPTEIPYQNISSAPSGFEGLYTLTCYYSMVFYFAAILVQETGETDYVK